VTTTTVNNFKDVGLLNDSLYCYKIKSIGTYNIDGLKTPLLNFSQEACSVPIDTTFPCKPLLNLSNFCLDRHLPENDFVNYLVWNFDPTCDTSTIIKTNIYYKANNYNDYVLLDTMPKNGLLAFTHRLDSVQSLAACYQLETVGKNGNKTMSNMVCSNDCPRYELPNTFTPNNDGQNDWFTPIIPYRSVEKIDIKIYDRWGILVYQTENPDINWNGTDIKNGKELPTAVYYYTCYLYYKTANGVEKIVEPLSGYIHLFR
ncbi:MAG TPA: gliding motility-associated C-terminal domain-containing protein, partial [Chitinophagales bacterium]|nr:gliding motility-associated C-terminal domain-containing protein [Chitinophagales bacterium]